MLDLENNHFRGDSNSGTLRQRQSHNIPAIHENNNNEKKKRKKVMVKKKRRRKQPSPVKEMIENTCICSFVFTLILIIPFWFSTHSSSTPSEQSIVEEKFKLQSNEAPSCDLSISTENDIEFTLVTQFSDDRLWMLQEHCERWLGSISISIFTNMTILEVESEITQFGSCNLDTMIIQTLSSVDVPVGDYPINKLRNMALSQVQTSHVFYVDIDFFEGYDLYEILHSTSVRKEFMKRGSLFASIIPAFAYTRRCLQKEDCRKDNLHAMPNTQYDLLSMMDKKHIFPFDPYNPRGQGSTHYSVWKAQETESFHSIDCFKSNRYEPFIAFQYCENFPPYQEVFTGYGKNKMTQVMHMRRSGYQFSQIGGAYVVHYPHRESKARGVWDESPPELSNFERNTRTMRKAKESGLLNNVDLNMYKRGQIDKLFVEFREWLDTKVIDKSVVPLCEKASDDDAKLWVLPNEVESSNRD